MSYQQLLRRVMVLVLLGSLIAPSASANSLWNSRSINIFSNNKAMKIGDIVTVIIVENSSASTNSQNKLTKDSSTDLSGVGSGKLDFIPLFGGKMSYTKDQQGKGQTTLSGNMTARVTAEVIEIRPNGNLVIEGSRSVEINEETDEIKLHGVIRPQDIASDNTILSTYLSEAQLSYAGTGPGKQAGRQGIVARLLDLVF